MADTGDAATAALLLRLLTALDVGTSAALAACMAAYRSGAAGSSAAGSGAGSGDGGASNSGGSMLTPPARRGVGSGGSAPATPTASLLASWRGLQSIVRPERKSELEELFMQLVARDTGGLTAVLDEVSKLCGVTPAPPAAAAPRAPPAVAAVAPPALPATAAAVPVAAASTGASRTQAALPRAAAAPPPAARMAWSPAAAAAGAGAAAAGVDSASGRLLLAAAGGAAADDDGAAAAAGACTDTAVVRVGDTVQLRSGSAGAGFLCVDAVPPPAATAPCAVAVGSAGAGHATEVFVVESAAGLPRATPLRCGDLLLLRSVGTGTLLCALPRGAPHQRALPPTASADGVVVAALPRDHDGTPPPPPLLFLPAAPDSLALAVAAGLTGSGAPLPRSARPLLATWQRMVLLAAPRPASPLTGSGAVAAARAAVVSRLALTAGVSTTSAVNVAGDVAVTATAVVYLDVLQPSHGGDALAAPHAAATWTVGKAPRAARSTGEMAYAPLPHLPEWAVLRPATVAATALPPAALPPSVARAVADATEVPAHAPVPPATALPLGVQEALLVDALLSALHGCPGGLVHCVLDGAALPAPALPSYGDALLRASFTLAPSLQAAPGARAVPPDAALAALASRVLPLATATVRARWLAEALSRPGAGRVAAAAAAAASHVLREYAAVLEQLDALARAQVRLADGGGGGSAGAAVASRPGYSPSTAAQPAVLSALSLQQLWFYLQPSLRTLTALEGLLAAARGVRGGALLNVLARAARDTGDDVTRTLALYLLEAAAAPYLAQLDAWLYQGAVADACDEFMVAAADAPPPTASPAAAATFWDSRFSLRHDMVPCFLAPHADSVLLAGKYLHVLRACDALRDAPVAGRFPRVLDSGVGGGGSGAGAGAGGGSADAAASGGGIRRIAPYATPTRFVGVDPGAYAGALHAAAARASRLLLQRFTAPTTRGGFALLSRLSTLKSFFLMAHGDFLTHFLDNAEGELAKELGAGGVSIHKLQVILDAALRSSTADGDAHKEEIACQLAPASLLATVDAACAAAAGGGGGGGSGSGAPPPPRMHSATAAAGGLKGYTVFTLDYAAAWPLNVVLSRAAIEQYQLLFRNLLFAKVVERAVVACWVAHQSCKELDMRATLALSYALRQRMLSFLQNIIYYQLAEVIEPRWHELLAGVRAATTVDDVIGVHAAFLAAATHDCLLTSPELLKLQTKLVTLCLLFANQITASIASHRLDDDELDARAGVNRASRGARAQLERGDYYAAGDDDDGGGGGGGDGDDARSVTARTVGGGGASRRRPSATAAPAAGKVSGVTRDRLRRKARVAVQTEAMQRTMAQAGWQAMIVKSSRMFDTLLRDFLGALVERTAGDYTSHLRHLCERLDFNGFYTRHLGLSAAAAAAAAPAGGVE